MTGDREEKRLCVEVAYALPDRQVLITLEVEEGTTVRQAVERSGILLRYPEMLLERGCVGVFGKIAPLDALLRDGDRVEIYRPLVVDPKEARLRRVRRRR